MSQSSAFRRPRRAQFLPTQMPARRASSLSSALIVAGDGSFHSRRLGVSSGPLPLGARRGSRAPARVGGHGTAGTPPDRPDARRSPHRAPQSPLRLAGGSLPARLEFQVGGASRSLVPGTNSALEMRRVVARRRPRARTHAATGSADPEAPRRLPPAPLWNAGGGDRPRPPCHRSSRSPGAVSWPALRKKSC